VAVEGASASWFRSDDHELVVTPERRLRRGEPFTTVVHYDGIPRTQHIPGFPGEAGFMHTDDGAVVAGEPETSANWYPVNDHPLDKATYTMEVTVPAGLGVVANGLLLSHTTAGRTTTWKWDERDPMASYLATINIGHYKVHTYKTRAGLRMYDAVDPDLYQEAVDPADPASPRIGAVADASLSHQSRIIDFLAGTFGPYPFSSGGGTVVDYSNFFFAQENQTRPVYSKYFFDTPDNGDLVIAHELAHQWYGDSVAVAHWKDIWLNEGFATYAEWLWSAHQGLGTEQQIFDFFYSYFPAEDPFWATVVADPGAAHLFDEPSYLRGAMTLHALRLNMGDVAFFKLLRAWATRQAAGNGSTEQFISLAETLSGHDLGNLFHTWLYAPSRPVLSAGAQRQTAGALLPRPPAAAASELARQRS
jgi:aminopeptidase N